ncbi:hypothetical protein PVAP13_5NG206200 [Panicum virgatum]|uniref:Uncharacterized protein n=1 Tax=Panicum virgatum TaxID=38727 RepID=A0A8T0RSF0_PANVG|nr:hypothetical protein PVAP13_5NG206200 [Panicum virgatum]
MASMASGRHRESRPSLAPLLLHPRRLHSPPDSGCGVAAASDSRDTSYRGSGTGAKSRPACGAADAYGQPHACSAHRRAAANGRGRNGTRLPVGVTAVVRGWRWRWRAAT